MTALNKILPGGRVVADDIRNVAPLSALKSIDEPVGNATLQADDALYYDLDADTNYMFVAFIDYEGGTAGAADMQYEWTLPAGASAFFFRGGINAAGAQVTGQAAYSGAVWTAGTNGAGVKMALFMFGTVLMGSVAGRFQFEFAQNSPNGVNTIVHAGSVLGLWEM